MTNDTNAYMRQLKWENKLAVATTIERVQSSFESIAYCFGHLESFYEYPVSILMRKDFPLANELNKFIQQANSNGFLSKWLEGNQFVMPIDIETDEKESEQVNVDTIFYLVIFHFTFSIGLVLLLAVERFIYKKVRSGNSSRFWRALEIGIDPYRHFLLRDLSY